MENIPSGQIQLGVWTLWAPQWVQDRALAGVQGESPQKLWRACNLHYLKWSKIHSRRAFFLCIASQNHRKKLSKFRTKSKHFQTNVGRLHSFIKVIKFYQDCGNHFKMNYIVADYSILTFSYLSYILCINHIAASTSVFCLILILVGQGTHSTQNRKLSMNIISRQNVHTYIIYLASLLVILTVIWQAWLGNVSVNSNWVHPRATPGKIFLNERIHPGKFLCFLCPPPPLVNLIQTS